MCRVATALLLGVGVILVVLGLVWLPGVFRDEGTDTTDFHTLLVLALGVFAVVVGLGLTRGPTTDPAPEDVMRFEAVGYGHPDAVALVEQVQAEYVVRYGSPDETPLDPDMFALPQGCFVVGYLGGVPVATGAWRRSTVTALGTDETAELKRMYVAPAARGAGHARRMLAHLEASAREHGARAMVLETGTAQPEAIALYTSSGYLPVPGFGHYRDAPKSRCFGKPL